MISPGLLKSATASLVLLLAACTSSSSKTRGGTGGAGGASGSGGVSGGTGAGDAGLGGTTTGGTSGAGGVAGGSSGAGGVGGAPQKGGDIDISIPHGFAVTDKYAFVSGTRLSDPKGGALNRLALSDGTLATWSDAAADLWGVAADESDAYAADFGQGNLLSTQTFAALTPAVASVTGTPYLVALDASHVYYDDQSGSKSRLFRKSRGAGGPEEIAFNVPHAWTMKVHGSDLFLTRYDSSQLYKIPTAATEPANAPFPLATLNHGSGAKGLAVNLDDVYVATREDSCSNGIGTHESAIFKVDRAFGTTTQIRAKEPIGITGLALHGANIYYSVVGDCGQEGTGKVMRFTPGQGAPVEVASKQAAPVDIAVHNNVLYWLNAGTSADFGAVMRLPLK